MKKREEGIQQYRTVEQAQKELGVSRSTLYRLLWKLGIAPVKAANVSLFTEDDIEAMKKERGE